MKLGIIGTGDLSESMVKIFLKNKSVSGSNISVFDLDENKLNYWAGTYDVVPCTELETVVQNCEILFISVSGQSFGKVISNADFLLKTYRPLVVSMVRGKSLEEIEDMMNFITPMARVSTNLNIGIGVGITAYCFNELVSDEQKSTLVELFSGAGSLVEIEEQYFEDFSALSSMASVCVCSLLETLTECGVAFGLPKDVAMKTALLCAFGTAKSIVDSKSSSYSELSKLCPPGSGAADSLIKLKENGFDKSIIRAYQAGMTNKN